MKQTDSGNFQPEKEYSTIEEETQDGIQNRLLNASNESYPVGSWMFSYEQPNELCFFEKYADLLRAVFPIIEKFIAVFESGSVKAQIKYNVYAGNGKSWEKNGIVEFIEGLTARIPQMNGEKIVLILLDMLRRFQERDAQLSRTKIHLEIDGQVLTKTSVWYGFLFDFSISQGLFEVNVRNFAFLPNNPVSRTKHYDTWAANAPRLAQCLNLILNDSRFDLSPDQERKNYGRWNEHNPRFLCNSPALALDWDESYIPYKLIELDANQQNS